MSPTVIKWVLNSKRIETKLYKKPLHCTKIALTKYVQKWVGEVGFWMRISKTDKENLVYGTKMSFDQSISTHNIQVLKSKISSFLIHHINNYLLNIYNNI